MKSSLNIIKYFAVSLIAWILIFPSSVLAASDNPQSGSIGLEGTISAPAPKQGATISSPSNGQSFSQTPIQVSGLCPNGLLVKIFSNNVFVGSARCVNGSYSLQIDLFSGRNDLVARVYDALDQAGPDSNVVSVTFNDGQFAQFGTRVSLTSSYARRGANPGDTLTWPVILSGGVGPYAISVDWGDGSAPDLFSQKSPGTIALKHVYDNAGIYTIVVKASDANKTEAFLQLVGVGNGQASQSSQTVTKNGEKIITKNSVVWWPMVVLIPLILIAFWLGRRHELYTIRKNLEQSRDQNS